MEKETLILKRAVESASLKMPMDNNGKDPAGIYKSITFYKIKEAEGFSFLRKGGVTYVTEQGVTEQIVL